MANFDIVIRGGFVADGRGGEPHQADVAISGGTIAEVGAIAGKGREEIDASGLLVTPGFVDIHTHLDGHVTWAEQMTPSSLHGVTTAVFGNCGVGFAPCRAEDRERLVSLMEGVEDIPGVVLAEGLPWNWTSFPDFLDALETRRYDIDVAAQLPHAPVRVFVMGERALRLEPATAEDSAKMAEIAAEAMKAGAFGFSTSRSINHRASDGSHTPTLEATESELTTIAEALGEGNGVIQMIADFEEPEADFDMMERIAGKSGRPLSFTLIQIPHAPERWKYLLQRVDEANDNGLTIKGQVCGRPVGVIIGFEVTFCPFSFCPSYQDVGDLPFSEKLARLRDPETRARILDEFEVPLAERTAEISRAFASRTVDSRSTARLITNLAGIYPLGDPPAYEPSPDQSIAAIARRTGRTPGETAYDMLLERDGRALLYVPASNFSDGTLDAVAHMLGDKNTVLGLSDAGAHCSLICDASFSTYMMTYWGRDRRPGLPLGEVVRQLTSSTAGTVGLFDRGIIAPGYRADLNIIDMNRLDLHPPKVVYDLPAGGKRLTQDADGYVLTIVNGVPTYRDGVHTGALPGRLIRKSDIPAERMEAAE